MLDWRCLHPFLSSHRFCVLLSFFSLFKGLNTLLSACSPNCHAFCRSILVHHQDDQKAFLLLLLLSLLSLLSIPIYLTIPFSRPSTFPSILAIHTLTTT